MLGCSVSDTLISESARNLINAMARTQQRTPLIDAAPRGQLDVMSLLFDAGADANARRSQWTEDVKLFENQAEQDSYAARRLIVRAWTIGTE